MSSHESQSFKPGDVILGRYRVLEILGKGGFGTVYKVEDQVEEKIFALKVIHIEEEDRPVVLAEARKHASVDHPNVVKVQHTHDEDIENGLLYLKMEYIEGNLLEDVVFSGVTSAKDASKLLRELLAGLEAIHEKKIAHLDLKPKNILVDRNGRVRLIDFGAAKWVAEKRDREKDKDLYGTPSYMAPEQLAGFPDPEGDRRLADIWAVGVLFWEILSARRFWSNQEAKDVLNKGLIQAQSGPVDWAERLRPIVKKRIRTIKGLPFGFKGILKRMLKIDPKKRFDTIAQVRKGLDRWEMGVKRGKKAAAAVALCLMILVGWQGAKAGLLGNAAQNQANIEPPVTDVILEEDISSIPSETLLGEYANRLAKEENAAALHAVYQEVVSRNEPQYSSRARFQLARLLQEDLERPWRSISIYQEILPLASDEEMEAQILYWMAQAYIEVERLIPAVENLEELVRRHPDSKCASSAKALLPVCRRRIEDTSSKAIWKTKIEKASTAIFPNNRVSMILVILSLVFAIAQPVTWKMSDGNFMENLKQCSRTRRIFQVFVFICLIQFILNLYQNHHQMQVIEHKIEQLAQMFDRMETWK